MASPVEQIKERLGIVDIVGAYLKLERAGTNLKARCPFHSEKTPSFFVSPARNTYHCFGCGARGDIFSFVQEFEGLDFPGALKVLADRAGVTLFERSRKEEGERARLCGVLESATAFYEQKFRESDAARAYLSGRGLSDETVARFRIGYAPEGWSGVSDFLKGKGYTDADAERAGLSKPGERGHYDRFRGRIMFPITDGAGRVIAFSGRILPELSKDDTPKYVNSPETVLFSKSHVLYGFDKAKMTIRKANFSIVVEGQMDLVMSHQGGFGNTVALSGTALTPEQVTLLKRLSGNVVLALDPDGAGVASAGRSALLALGSDMDVKIAALPGGKDPADLIRTDPEGWRAVIRGAKHVVDFFLDNVSARGLDPRARTLAVRSTVLPYVARIVNRMDQAHFIARVASAVGLPEDSVRMEVAKVPAEELTALRGAEGGREKGGEAVALSRARTIRRRLIGILLWQESLAEPSIDVTGLAGRLTAALGEEDFARVRKAPEAAKSDLLFEVELLYQEVPHLDREVAELLDNLREETVRERLSTALRDMKQAEAAGDDAKVKELFDACAALSKELAALNRERVV